jgi:lysophospholipase L1-like esterase
MGDSITHGGSYHKYIELYYSTRFPTRPIEVINCGIAGDTAPGALQRLQWDCLDAKPTVVSLMFGMNDVGRSLYDAGITNQGLDKLRVERAGTYDMAMRKLTASLLDSGAKVILIKPSIFDDTADLPKANSPGCGAALAAFAARVQVIADEFKVPTVDFNSPLAAINRELQKMNPHFTIVGADRVHPASPGHLVMAYEFLRAQKAPAHVSQITIDAAAGRVGRLENCEVSHLSAQSNAVSFTCLEAALPFPVEASAAPALGYISFTQELNQETLQVRGLAPGSYELSIDGRAIRSFTAAELADGVNLAGETNAPQLQQSLQVLSALRRKWEAVGKLRTIAYVEHTSWPDAEHPVDVAQLTAKAQERLSKVGRGNDWIVAQHRQYSENKPRESEWRAEVNAAVAEARRISQPKPHRFELKLNQ